MNVSIDTYSEEWKAIDRWAAEKLLQLRERNDNKSLDIVRTSVLRGEIRVLKELRKLPEGGQ